MENNNTMDLNHILITYVDLRCDEIWSTTKCKEMKWELKEQSIYFRLVKQGSILVYLTFHIFTIFMIFLMVTMRQSLIALVYILILLPRIKEGAEVLSQRTLNK